MSATPASLAEIEQAFARGDDAQVLMRVRAALAAGAQDDAVLGLGINAAIRAGDLDAAIAWTEQLATRQPQQQGLRRTLSTLLNRRGARAREAGAAAAALEDFTRALAAWPDNREALYNRAQCCIESRHHAHALPHLQRLLQFDPGDAAARRLLAEAQVGSGDESALDEARRCLERAHAEGRLDDARLAGVLADADAADAALLVIDRVESGARPTATTELAFRLLENALPDAARRAFARAAVSGGRGQRAPSLVACIAEALALPRVYADAAQVERERARYGTALDALVAEFDARRLAACAPALEQLRWSNWVLSYQGRDDRALQHAYGDWLARAAAIFAPDYRAPPARRRAGAPRVALLSSAFTTSTIGSYFGSWPRALAGAGLDTTVLQLGPGFDAETERIGAGATRLVRLDGDMARAARAVREHDFDLLLYPDLGVDPRLLPLAALPLARRQWMAWGHPATSGLPGIERFLSCAAMEPDGAAAHYREQLTPLPGIGTAYAPPPPAAPLVRAELGLPGGRLYLVPQYAHKLHPEGDAVFAAIAAADPDATLLFFAADRPGATRRLRARLERALREAGADPARQMRFLPQVTRRVFLAICAASDVMVDCLHWSGGNTTLDALSVGLPVVTCPGELMRGRQSLAMLQFLGVGAELVAADPQGLAKRALEIAREPGRREVLRRTIAERLAVLYDGRQALEAMCATVQEAVTS
jgi:CRISPR-associated protein Csy1